MSRTRSAAGILSRFNAPVYALPVDLFRVLTGLVTIAYFARIFMDTPEFSSPGGLIDHNLLRDILPFTRIGLFHPGMGLIAFRIVFAFAVLAAVGLTLGYRPKLWAACLYLIAVSTYRWNFLVIYVDDAIIHLMLFWMLLLPIGRTLTLREWATEGKAAWIRWKTATAPGVVIRCFMINIALIYVVAGLWKWTSPMWRDGAAVYAILKTPLSYAPDWWGASHAGFLVLMNYLALFFEPLFPLLFIWRRGPVRYLLIAALVGFHAFILATMKVPFANAACLAAAVLLLRDDLMFLLLRSKPPIVTVTDLRTPWGGVCAGAMVVVLALAMLTSVILPDWRTPRDVRNARRNTVDIAMDAGVIGEDGLGKIQEIFFSTLWAAGLAQQYQLLNWIDNRNFRFIYAIEEIGADGASRAIDGDAMFPDNLRSVLLQSHLHGAVWLKIAPKHVGRLRGSLKARFAARYCRLFLPAGKIVVKGGVQRPEMRKPPPKTIPSFEMKFSCRAGTPVFAH
jgi:hypothetical protein